VNRSIGVLIISVIFPYATSATEPQPPDPAAIVEKAVANYRARGDHRRNYAYMEEVRTAFHNSYIGSNTYENILVKGEPHRQHITFNGKRVPPETANAERQKMVDAAWYFVPESFKVTAERVDRAEDYLETSSDPQLQRFRSGLLEKYNFMRRNGHTENHCIAVYPRHLFDFELALEQLDHGFVFRPIKDELLDGRMSSVFEATPASGTTQLTDSLKKLQPTNLD
jgi:hypothetical protein